MAYALKTESFLQTKSPKNPLTPLLLQMTNNLQSNRKKLKLLE